MRTMVVIIGILGALAVLDALVLFVVVLLAGPAPYVGLLLFVAVPVAMVVGMALLWAAFRFLGADPRAA